MNNSSSWFFVLEGSDGSGKSTQLNLLKARLEAAGYDVAEFDFPRYDKQSSYFVKQYLSGGFGPSNEVSPYTASLFYALDRFEAAPLIRQAISDGKIVLSNRYVGSNMAHQGGKFSTEGEQRGFFLWEDSLEFQLMGIPRPMLNIFLRLPVGVTQDLIRSRAKRDGRKLDEHEKNTSHLKKALATFDLLCQLFPKDFKAVECAPGGKLLSVAQISDLIWDLLKPMLPNPSHPGKARIVKLNEKTNPASLTINADKPLLGSESDSNSQAESSNAGQASLLLLNKLAGEPRHFSNSQLIWSKAPAEKAYYLPAELPKKIKKDYNEFMRYLLEATKQIESKLHTTPAKDTSRVSAEDFQRATLAIVPMAAIAKADFIATVDLKKLLISDLSDANLSEAKLIYSQIFKRFAERVAVPSSPSTSQIAKRLIEDKLPQNLADNESSLQITEFSPANEFDHLVDFIYPLSDQPTTQLTRVLDSLAYEQKLELLKQAGDHDATNMLSNFLYEFDVVEDQLFFDELKNLNIVESFITQRVSPRFGYEVPAIIESAKLEDEFFECFDRSLELYSNLQAAKLENLAEYVCLKGHRSRARFKLTAHSVQNRLKKGGLSKNQSRLFKKIIDAIGQVHPIVGEVLMASLKQQKDAAGTTQKQTTLPGRVNKSNPSRRRRPRTAS